MTELKDLDLFADLRGKELRKIESLCTKTTIPAGMSLTAEGSYNQQALIFLDGSASVIQDGEQIAEIGPGDLVGEIALLKGRRGKHTATVTTTTDTTALIFNADEFQQILDDHPTVARRIAETALARLNSDAE